MKTSTKIILISSLVVVLTVTIFVVRHFVRKKEEERLKQEQEEQKKAQEKYESEYILPKFNRNGELINTLSELKKVTLIAKKDGTNLRSSAEINNDSGFWDLGSFYGAATNILATVKKNSVIGSVENETKGKETPPMRWFKVKLKNSNYVYVRADVVTFNKIKK
jgi:uncharacterized protein YxeA